ncbi:alpha/beta fold hydrolase [Muricoccus radiodurans]|uniref:alpha/beta fold hydrolase n=1 Tax=Muricoccus radiodurans TaxID=2231721 RepID=UPI003CF2711F
MDIQRGLVRTRLGHVHYRKAGAGPNIMLFHINQQSSALMLELMAALAPRFQVVAMDYPGYGHSDHVESQPTIQDYAGVAVELMDALGIRKTHVMGEAVGTFVATEIAGAHPDRVEKAVLVNCPYVPGKRPKGTGGDVDHAVRPTDPSGFPVTRTIDFVLANDPEHSPMNPTQSWMDRINTAQIEAGRNRWQALEALHLYDLPRGLERITCPVLMLTGENFYFVQHREPMLKHLRDARMQVIPGARFCMTWERAEDVGAAATAFLSET